MKVRCVATVAALLGLAAATSGQLQFQPAGKLYLPHSSGAPLASGDVNGDGYRDWVGFDVTSGQVYLGAGDGRFAAGSVISAPPTNVAGAAFADVDGDGDLDLVLSAFDSVAMFTNDGQGNFADATNQLPAVSGSVRQAVFGDVDGDRDPDLVIAFMTWSRQPQNLLLLNDGAGRFSDATGGRMPPTPTPAETIALADLDGDGDLDLVAGHGHAGSTTGEFNSLFLNDGSGKFSLAPGRLPAHRDNSIDVAAGDFDGDGAADLVFGNTWTPNSSGTSRLYLNSNDGTATFRDATANLPLPAQRAARLGLIDIDGDRDLDLVMLVENPQPANRIYINDGRGVFTDETSARTPAAFTGDLPFAEFADFTGDGACDAVMRGPTSNHLYLNDRNGKLLDDRADPRLATADNTLDVAAGDLDGDGLADLVLSDTDNGARVLWGDGNGSHDGELSLPKSSPGPLAIADVDGDGDLDIAVGGAAGTPVRLYQNQANQRSFADRTAATMPSTSTPATALAFGDADGDGDLDLLVAAARITGAAHFPVISGAPNRLYLNDGAGSFRDGSSLLPANANASLAVAWLDIDGDGRQDAFFGNMGRNRLYRNTGAAFADVTSSQLPATGDGVTQDVAVGDLDRDGRPELFIANGFGFIGGQTHLPSLIYHNDGQGGFSPWPSPSTSLDNTAVALADIDADGDLDLLLGHSNGRAVELYLGDGRGGWRDATTARVQPLLSGYEIRRLVVADVDADRDLDAVVARGSRVNIGAAAPDQVVLNHHRQLRQPTHSLAGGALQFDYHRAPGYVGSGGEAVAHFIAPRPARLLVPPFGTFGLDPTVTIQLNVFFLPPSGSATRNYLLPNDPAVRGLTHYSQAIFVPYDWTLTNVASDVIY